jgi:CPA1 family monovalent cation:H+ antiporter
MVSRRIRQRDPSPPWQHTLVISWTGMRGAVSLAAALAVPLTIDSGAEFPDRNRIIFLAFSVILGTLLIQGLSLPPLIRVLGLDDRDEDRDREESEARRAAAVAALERIDELVEEEWVREETAERVRGAYRYRTARFAAQLGDGDGDSDAIEARSADYQRLVRDLLDTQRATLIELRNAGEIDDDVLRRIETELDHEDSRLEI